MLINKTSQLTGVTHNMHLDITQEQLDKWRSGMLIQDAMPHLTPDEREFLMTGATKEEWEAAFA
jgi:hypothetical protein